MKLRIKGNSLRLRISRSELTKLNEGERLVETVRFTPAPDAQFSYALEATAQIKTTAVKYSAGTVTVCISHEQLWSWSDEKEVGIYTSVEIGDGEKLDLLIEKDFACLDRSDEENADTFSNPHAGATC
jgi:hypothetical protein